MVRVEPLLDIQRDDVEPDGIPALLRLDRFSVVTRVGDQNAPMLRAEGGFAERGEVAYHTAEWAEVKRGEEWIGTLEWKTYHLRDGAIVLLAAMPWGMVAASNDARGLVALEAALAAN